jgi:hypothetical protein
MAIAFGAAALWVLRQSNSLEPFAGGLVVFLVGGRPPAAGIRRKDAAG